MRAVIKFIFLAAFIAFGFTVSLAAAQDSPGDPERGGELYVENCSMCHGIEGKGRVGASLEQFPGIQASSALEQTISEGIDGSVMPAWGRAAGGPLTSQDIADIAAYILDAFHGTSPIAPAPTYQPPEIPPFADISGDPALGAVVYFENCRPCHGNSGEGRFGKVLAKNWPGNQPALFIQQVVEEGISGTTMPAWVQEQGGPLSEDDIENVTVFVLSLDPIAEDSPSDTVPEEKPLDLKTSLILIGVVVLIVFAGLVIYYRRA